MTNKTEHLPFKLLLALATLIVLQPAGKDLALSAAFLSFLWLLLEERRNELRGKFLLFALSIASCTLLYFGLAPAVIAVLFVTLTGTILNTALPGRGHLAAWVASLALTQFPPISTAIIDVSDYVPPWSGVLIAPFTFVLFGTVFRLLKLHFAIMTIGVSTLLASLGNYYELSPMLTSMLCALPVAGLPIFALHTAPVRTKMMLALVTAGALAAAAWLIPITSAASSASIWLPTQKTQTSRFFEHYDAVVKVTGLGDLRIISSASEVAPGEIVIFPNAAHPEFSSQLAALRSLPDYKSIRILVFGEHTDADGVAEALVKAGSPIGLNSDTTIPPNNENYIGWINALSAVPSAKLALNRGASVRHRSFMSTPLLWISGGHREEDRSEDGRIGDYVFRNNERVGPYSVMSIGREAGGATWIVVGDSTPALNEFLVADPKGFAQLLSISTGIPTAFTLLLWILLFVSVMPQSNHTKAISNWAVLFAAFSVPISFFVLTGSFFDAKNSQVKIYQRDIYGERAVGRGLVSLAADLSQSGVRIEVGKVSRHLNGKLISIGHPESWSSRQDCTRTGAIEANQLKLLDVLTCPESAKNSVFSIGSDTVVFKVDEQTVILDQHFIANAAPPQNIEWIKTYIRGADISR